MRRGVLLATFLVAALVAGGIVAGLSGRSDLEEARRRVDGSWARLEEPLNVRFRALAEVIGPLEAALGHSAPEEGAVSLAVDARQALARWERSTADGESVEERVQAASVIEGIRRRIATTVEASPRLRASKSLPTALSKAAATTDDGAQVTSYNEAVQSYEELRGGLARRLLAAALGFDSRPTLELPT